MNVQIALVVLVFSFSACKTEQKQKEVMQWKIAANIPSTNGIDSSIGIAGPITGYFNNYLLVAGGANFPEAMPWNGGNKVYHQQLFLYKVQDTNLIAYPASFLLPEALAYAAGCSTPKGIFVAGGENDAGISSKSWLITWNNTPDSIAFLNLPDLPLPLTNASAVSVGDLVYVAGGETYLKASDLLFCINLQQIEKGWETLQPIPVPVSHFVFLYNEEQSKLYLVGGRKKNDSGISTIYNSLYSYDITGNQWQEEAPLPYPLSAGTGVLQHDNILLIGGDKGETFSKTEQLIAAIKNEEDETRRNELTIEKNNLQQSHPGFSKEILEYNLKDQQWRVHSAFPFETPVTTTAVSINSRLFIPSGEIKAGVRTPAIITGIEVENK